MSSLKDNEKKALVKLQLKHKDTKEDKTELGFAVKVKNRSCDETAIITSSSVLPGNTLQNGYEVVINHYPSKYKLFGGKPSSKVIRIKAHDTMDVSVARFEGGDKEHFLDYIALPEKKKKESKMLSAFVFEGKEIIELKFGNKGGSYQFNSVSKTDFDVKRAKGAPVIYQFANGRNVVVGVLSISDQDLLYPVLFKDHMFDTDARSSSSDDVAKPGPSQTSIQQPVVSELEQLQLGQEKITQGQSSLQHGQERILQGQFSLQQGQAIQSRIVAVLILVVGCILYGHYKDNYQAALVFGLISTCLLTVLWYLINWALMFAYIRYCSKALKSSIKGCTEYLPKVMASNNITSARTDDIFTNVTVYYDRKQVKKGQVKGLSRGEQLQEYYKDVFFDTVGKNLKRLLIIGKPGIGKSLFCLKLVRDWVHMKLFQNIRLTYLLTFRQLEALGNKELNFRELLNCSALLDEHSIIDDSLFEYLMKNSSKVLIILDGYDEYSKQHREEISDDNLEQKYSNNPREKMPVPALCSKLIKGKIFRESVVLISSRPGEAEGLGQFHFDGFVEIAGFSSEQVTEFVEKYFSKTKEEETKKTAREHIEKNEILVSFCHIPLLCLLLCWCLEWRISQSGNAENLPAKITDLYHEVVQVSLEKLHAKLKYAKITETVKRLAQETLTKLEQLAGYSLKQNKYIFTEEDMKKSNLTQDEIENLKISGLLHSLPAARISAFELKDEYSFIHLTLQEYLSACSFVKNQEVPDKNKTSGQTLIFMSGLLSRERDDELMKKLMEEIKPRDEYDDVNRLLTLQCLYEYRDDELSKLTINNLQDEYGTLDGVIGFDGITDVDVQCLSYLLNIIHLLLQVHHVQSFSRVHALYIDYSPVTPCGVGVLCKSLVHHSYITRLSLDNCTLDDNCIELIANSLLNTKITYLNLPMNNITDKGAESILSVLLHENCCVEALDLTRNEKITEECKERLTKRVREKKPYVKLYI